MKYPDLRTYLSIQQYLSDLYHYRKASEPDFSYESWSLELKIKNRSFLRQIVVGRRTLTENTIQILCRSLRLEGMDREYFEILALYSKSRNTEQRNQYGRKLMRLLKLEYEQVEINNYSEFVSHPFLPKLLTLLSFKDIKKDPATLAVLLRSSASETAQALNKLQKLELVESLDDGSWASKQRSFKVPDVVGESILLDYHAQALQEAIQARSAPAQERRYKSLLLPLSVEEFAEFAVELQDFVRSTLKKYDVDDLRQRKLHQVNFNIYSVSEDPAEITTKLRRFL